MTLNGANHYGICDENDPPGATADPIAPTLGQAESNFNAARWIGLWLRAQLKDDHWAQFWIYRVGGSFNGVVDVVAEETL
jgi:hypothetical protein